MPIKNRQQLLVIGAIAAISLFASDQLRYPRRPPHPQPGPPIIPPPIMPAPMCPYFVFHIMFGPGSGTTEPVHRLTRSSKAWTSVLFSSTSA